MNTLTFKLRPYFLPALLAVFMLTSCDSPKKLAKNLDKMKLKSQPEVLQVNGDSIEVKILIKIPPKTFGKKAMVKFQPILKYGEEEKAMDPLYLQGEKVKDKKGAVIKFAKGGSKTYDKKIEYTPEMKKSKLSMEYQIKIASKYDELNQCINGKRDSTTNGTITTSLTVKPYDDIFFFTGNEHPNLYDASVGGSGAGTMGAKTADALKGKPQFTFYYVINEGNLRDSAKRGPSSRTLARLIGPKDTKAVKKGKKGKNEASDEKELRDAMNAPKCTGVVFKSYASPDGELNKNAQLCQDRATSSNDFVKKEFKRLGVKEINDADFIKKPDANEDWAGLKTLVEQSNMKGKSDILAVINSGASVDEKEKQLRSLPSWKDLAKNILPRLRRTEVYLLGLGDVKTGSSTGGSTPRTVSDIKTAHSSGADSTISQREMLILAANMDDMAERERIYKMYSEKYPKDWTGMNNYAAIMLKTGSASVKDENTALKSNAKIDASLKMFEDLHSQYPNNDTITNNLGVAKRFARKYNDAQSSYVTSKNDGMKEDNNMGILFIKYGWYEKATTSFESSRCDYNVALAYTLKGDYDQALNKLDCIQDKKSEEFYLRSIIGARKNDKTLMTTALTRAVQMDASLRDRAKSDMEFHKFWESAEFKNAIR